MYIYILRMTKIVHITGKFQATGTPFYNLGGFSEYGSILEFHLKIHMDFYVFFNASESED